MRKLCVFIMVVLLFPALAFSQQGFGESLSFGTKKKSQKSGLFAIQPQFGLQLGSSFTTGYTHPLFTQSVAPHLTFEPGKNFSFRVGSVFSSSNLSSAMPFAFQGSGFMPDRFYSTTVYAIGAYSLNPKLTLTGATWMERNNMNMFQNQMNPQAFNLNAGGMMMGFDYRFNERFSFGAEINVSRGYNPFDMYHSRGYEYNPFHPWNRR